MTEPSETKQSKEQVFHKDSRKRMAPAHTCFNFLDSRILENKFKSPSNLFLQPWETNSAHKLLIIIFCDKCQKWIVQDAVGVQHENFFIECSGMENKEQYNYRFVIWKFWLLIMMLNVVTHLYTWTPRNGPQNVEDRWMRDYRWINRLGGYISRCKFLRQCNNPN